MTAHRNTEAARDLARRAFWSEHPLCDLYSIAMGGWDSGGRFWRARAWSVKSLIAFAEALPPQVIHNLTRQDEMTRANGARR